MRNVSMPGTGKGIYVKSNADDCSEGKSAQLTNLLFEDFRIEDPFWYAIWIGPQQQHEPNTALGGKCALDYPLGDSDCPTQGCASPERNMPSGPGFALAFKRRLQHANAAKIIGTGLRLSERGRRPQAQISRTSR